jgi:hypothetical protein
MGRIDVWLEDVKLEFPESKHDARGVGTSGGQGHQIEAFAQRNTESVEGAKMQVLMASINPSDPWKVAREERKENKWGRSDADHAFRW